MAATNTGTQPRQFRLTQDTLDQLDRIAVSIGALKPDGSANRAAAIRFAATIVDKKIPKKSSKSC